MNIRVDGVLVAPEDFMASFAPLTSEDIFADLGSGRGGVLVQVRLQVIQVAAEGSGV